MQRRKPRSESKPVEKPTVNPDGESAAKGGYEKSAEQDAKSNQGPGKHSRDVELKIAENMPDRK